MNKKSKTAVFFILSFLCLTLLCVLLYVKRNFVFTNSNPVQQILFHLIVQVDGANPTFIRGIVIRCLVLPLIGAILITLFLFGNFDFLQNIQKLKP